MKRRVTWLLLAELTFGMMPAPAFAGVNVERHGTENPMVEVFKATMYGALTGAVVGGVIVLAAQGDSDTNGDIMRWSIVGGTVVGLGVGFYFVAKRPQPSGLIELKNGALGLHASPPQIGPGGEVRVRVVGVRF